MCAGALLSTFEASTCQDLQKAIVSLDDVTGGVQQLGTSWKGSADPPIDVKTDMARVRQVAETTCCQAYGAAIQKRSNKVTQALHDV